MPYVLIERAVDEDDHFYGAWTKGGGRAAPRSSRQAAALAFPKPKPRRFPDDPPNAAAKWGYQHYESWARGLSQSEKKALNAYSGGFYKEMNQIARGDYVDPVEKKYVEEHQLLENLDDALEDGIVPEDVIVWRGASGAAIPEGKVGKVFESPGYVSTSLREETARFFMSDHLNHDLEGTPVLAEIMVPKGTKGAYMQARWLTEEGRGMDLQNIVGETELTLARNLRFKVLSDQMKKVRAGFTQQYRHVKLEVVS